MPFLYESSFERPCSTSLKFTKVPFALPAAFSGNYSYCCAGFDPLRLAILGENTIHFSLKASEALISTSFDATINNAIAENFTKDAMKHEVKRKKSTKTNPPTTHPTCIGILIHWMSIQIWTDHVTNSQVQPIFLAKSIVNINTQSSRNC